MEGKEEIFGLVRFLCEQVRSAVRPMLGLASAKEAGARGATGDTTFGIDEVAEEVVSGILEDTGDIAYYTEDRGMVVLGEPRFLLVIDPIDGTRPAAAGLESCCVSVAAARYEEEAARTLTLGDVFMGMVSEIKNRAVFSAVRGEGVEISRDGAASSPLLSSNKELGRMFWTAGFRGRPALPLVTVLEELIDLSSVDGGCFDLGSATFCITRIVTGDMDAYVDVGQRMAEEVEEVRELFLQVGHGAILNNYPYDLAAAALIAAQSGAVVSDAYGRSLDDYPLVPRGGTGQLSSLVTANPELHGSLVEKVDEGIERLKARYRRTGGR